MIYLALTIFFTASIFWIFKWHSQKGLHLEVCISANYISAGISGLVVNALQLNQLQTLKFIEFTPLFGMGFLFIVVFMFMGLSTKNSGIGLTVLAAKLSVLITVLLSVLVFNEVLELKIWMALPMAIASIVLYQWRSIGDNAPKQYLLPILVLVGSGGIDFLLAIISKGQVLSQGLNASIIFLSAAFFGLIYIIFGRFRIKRIDLLIGMVLGVVNYASIHFFLMAFSQTNENSWYFLVFSIGTLMLSSLGSFWIFKEKINRQKKVALLLACAALLLSV